MYQKTTRTPYGKFDAGFSKVVSCNNEVPITVSRMLSE